MPAPLPGAAKSETRTYFRDKQVKTCDALRYSRPSWRLSSSSLRLILLSRLCFFGWKIRLRCRWIRSHSNCIKVHKRTNPRPGLHSYQFWLNVPRCFEDGRVIKCTRKPVSPYRQSHGCLSYSRVVGEVRC